MGTPEGMKNKMNLIARTAFKPEIGIVLPMESAEVAIEAMCEGMTDGKTVLTGSSDKTARRWDVATCKQLVPLLQHQGPVRAVAFSPDGKTILTGCHDHTARLWDVATAKQLTAPLQHMHNVEVVAYSPDGKTVLTGSRDNTARLWEAATGKLLGTPMQHRGEVRAIAFSPDGMTVLTGSWDYTARLWRIPHVHGNPEQILLWPQVLTGLELDEYGLPRALDAASWQQRRRRLEQLGGVPEN